jgi:serine/threonine protein kinase
MAALAICANKYISNIACGGMACVFLLQDETGKKYAGKIYKKEYKKYADNESKILQRLKYKLKDKDKEDKNKFVDFIETCNFSPDEDIKIDNQYGNFELKKGEKYEMIVMEYVENCKELFNVIFIERQKIDINLVFLNILKVVQLLHSLNIFHLDLTLSNFLYCDDNKVKLIDFGGAQVNSVNVDIYGTDYYIDPLIYQKAPPFYKCDKADIYSLGIIYLLLIFSENKLLLDIFNDFPKNKNYFTLAEFNQKILKFINENLTDLTTKEILNSMLSLDEKKRFNIDELEKKVVTTNILFEILQSKDKINELFESKYKINILP